MLRFFRNIRQKLAAENKVMAYLRYAIGEILLVVIGILIALQVNNWKEDSKTNKLEIKILKELHSNLTSDLNELRDDVANMDSINNACKVIQHYLQTNDNPSNFRSHTYAILRVTPHFDPNKSGYELLQSKGLEVISNDSLRALISLLYERSYPYYHRYEEGRLRFHAIHSEPLLLKYFSMHFRPNTTFLADFSISLKDYKKLKNDDSFIKLLSAIAFENSGVQYRGIRIEKDLMSLLNAINNEIRIKEN